jgi:hypothetical protein
VANRVTDSLQLLFNFDSYTAGSSTITSNGGAAGSITMNISDTSRVNKITGGIEITNAVRISSSSVPTTLINNIKASDAITIEAWISPSNTNQTGPANIVTLSYSTSYHNFSLDQDGTRYQARLRTSTNDDNGENPATRTNSNATSTSLTHVVYTYSPSDGKGRIYINGTLVKTTNSVGGNLDNWSSLHTLIFGNDMGGSSSDHDWRGKIYTVAIYSKALSDAEVLQNYNYGEE